MFIKHICQYHNYVDTILWLGYTGMSKPLFTSDKSHTTNCSDQTCNSLFENHKLITKKHETVIIFKIFETLGRQKQALSLKYVWNFFNLVFHFLACTLLPMERIANSSSSKK